MVKRSYSRLVEMKMQTGINYINKLEFLEVYPSVRIEAFKSETIKNSFSAAGLIPFSPDRVLSKLNICLRTPTPPPPLAGVVNQAEILPQKHILRRKNYVDRLHQSKLYFEQDLEVPLSPSDRALNQLIKGFRLTMQGAILLAKENKELRAARDLDV